jgi:hypothetical protein
MAGCSTVDLASAEPTGEPGMASVSIAFAPNSPFATAARTALVTITASDMDSILQSLTVGDSTVSGTVDRIPAGPARVFRIDVRDSSNVLAYQGRDTVDILPGTVASVDVTVRRL